MPSRLVVILDINPTSFGVIQNLKEANLEFFLISTEQRRFSNVRFLPFEAGSDEDDPENLTEFLLRVGRSLNERGFIIPTNEAEILFLSSKRDHLSQYFEISIAKEEALRKIVDKYTLYKELVRLSVNTPRTVLLESIEPIEITKREIKYPCLLKPVFSRDWKTAKAYGIVGDQKAIVLRDELELKACYETVEVLSSRILLQEIVDVTQNGTYSFCGYADYSGKVVWGFVTQKILQYPEKFGTALLCQTKNDPEIYEFGKRVIEKLAVDGIFEVEILRSRDNHSLQVIEINTRHWLQHRLSTRLGVNITLLDYYYRMGNRIEAERLLSGVEKDRKPVIWIDDVGYLFHCIKNGFRLQRCRFTALAGKTLELSTWSVTDWRPFYWTLKRKVLS